MTEYAVVSSTWAHAQDLADRMRGPDRREVWAASHQTPEGVICLSMVKSDISMTGLADGQVVCMFGIGSVSVLSLTGVPWMLATDDLEKHARAFLRRNKKVLAEMSEGYTLLRNYVDERNTVAIRWLEWLGFTILPPIPFGMDQLPFHPFEMKLSLKA